MRTLVLVALALVVAAALWLWPRREGNAGEGLAPANRLAVSAPPSTNAGVAAQAASQASVGRERVTASGGAEEARGSLLVTVLWKQDRSPAAAAAITILPEGGWDSREGRTDAHGAARFENLWLGPIVVVADRGEVMAVELAAGTTREVTIERDGGGEVDGSVVDWNGTAVTGADVQLLVNVDVTGLEACFRSIATSDRSGAFHARGLRQGQQIIARKAGNAPSAVTTVVLGQGELKLVLPARGASLRVRVCSAGKPLVDATLSVGLVRTEGTPYAYPNRRAPNTLLRTDPSGTCFADDLPAGATHAFASARGHVRAERSLTLELGKTVELEIDLAQAGTVQGKVRDPQGKPLPAWVALVSELEGPEYAKATAERGFHFGAAPPGDLWVEARHDGHLPARVAAKVRALETTVCDVVLTPRVVPLLRGRLQDEARRELAGWKVQAFMQGDPRRDQAEGKSTSAGRFALEAKAGVAYVLRVQDPARRAWIVCSDLGPITAAENEIVVTIAERDRPGAFLEGTLVDESGRRLPNVELVLSDGLAPTLETVARTAEGGRFQLGPLARGSYLLRTGGTASSDVAPADLVRFELAAGQQKDLGTVRAPRGRLFSYRLLDPEGRAASGVIGAILDEDGGPVAALAPASGHGDVRLLPGRYRLAFLGYRDWAWGEAPFTIGSGEDQRLDVHLERGVQRALQLRWPSDARPKTEQSARIQIGSARGSAWRFDEMIVEPELDADLNIGLSLGKHEATLTLDDGTRYQGTFEVDSLDARRAPIRVDLQRLR